MNILVLGGTRFFGKRLVQFLVDGGHRVTVATRGQSEDPFGDAVDRVHLDRTDGDSMGSALAGRSFDLVYDQICYNPWSAKVAVDALGSRVGRYVYTSSISVYSHKDGITREADFDPVAHPYRLDAPAWTYEEGKREVEAYFFQKAPFPVVAARVAMVVSGTDDYTERFDFHVAHVARRQSIGLEPHEHPITYVTAWDTAAFLRFVGTQSAFSGPVTVGNVGFFTPSEICREIGKTLHVDPLFHEAGEKDPDLSPYAMGKTVRASVDLAREIGYPFPDLLPQVPGMVEEVKARLALDAD